MILRVAMLRMSVYFTDTGMEFLGVGCDGIIQQMHICFSIMPSQPLGRSSVPWSFGGSLPWPFRGGSLPWPAGGAVLCFGPWACANAERTRRIRPRAIIRPASSTSCGAIHGAIAKSLLGITCCRAGVGKTPLLDATRMHAVDQ